MRVVTVPPRSWEVAAELLADGAGNCEIAGRLCVSEDTVKTHLRHLLREANCATRTEFVARTLHGRIRLVRGSRWNSLEVKEVA